GARRGRGRRGRGRGRGGRGRRSRSRRGAAERHLEVLREDLDGGRRDLRRVLAEEAYEDLLLRGRDGAVVLRVLEERLGVLLVELAVPDERLREALRRGRGVEEPAPIGLRRLDAGLRGLDVGRVP